MHSAAQIGRLRRSITEYGCNQPVAISADVTIACGSGLVAAALKLKLPSVPVICLEHLSEGQLRAYAIAADKLADMSGYDEVELSLELADIQALLGTIDLPELRIETPELDRPLDLGIGLPNMEEEVDELEPATGRSLVQPNDV